MVEKQLSADRIRWGLGRNVRLLVVARVLSVAASLVPVPVIVWKLGISGLGVWEASLAFSTLAALVLVPIGGTLLWRASGAYAPGSSVDPGRLLRLGISATAIFALVALPASWGARNTLVRIFNVPAGLAEAASFVLPGLVAVAVIGGVNESLSAILSGRQEAGLVATAQSVGICVNYAVVIGCLVEGAGIWSVLAGSGAGAVTTGLLLYAFLSGGSEVPSLLPVLPSATELRPLRRYFGLLSIGSGATALREQKDKVLLAAFASPEWTGYYSIAFRLASLVMLVGSLFYVPSVSAAGALEARNDREGIRRLFSETTAALTVAAGGMAVAVGASWDRLVFLWLGRAMPQAGTILLWLLVGHAAAVLLTGPGTAIARGVGKPEIETRFLVLNLVLNVALTIALVTLVGPMGTAAATGLSWILASIVFASMAGRSLGIGREPVRMAGTALACAMMAIAAARAASITIPFPSERILLAATAGLLVMLACAVYLGLLALLGVSPVRLALRVFRPEPLPTEAEQAGTS